MSATINTTTTSAPAAAAAEPKRKHSAVSEQPAVAAAAAAADAGTKKQKTESGAALPTGVAVVVFTLMNSCLHVLGFQEDRHAWPEGVREKWDALFLRNTGRGSFPSSPFQLYTDVPTSGVHVPGYVFENAHLAKWDKDSSAVVEESEEANEWFKTLREDGEHWTQRHCHRLMLLHMLGKGWAPVCVAEQFAAADKTFAEFVAPHKQLQGDWKQSVVNDLTEQTWRAFAQMIRDNQPHEDWHFVTVPAENCRGKDMSTEKRCREEAVIALHEEAFMDYDDNVHEYCAKVTTGKFKTSVHAVGLKDRERAFADMETEMRDRQDEFQWRCPHNWAGARGGCVYKSADGKTFQLFDCKEFKTAFEKSVKAYRETCKPRWVPLDKVDEVFDVKSRSAVALVADEVKKHVC